MSGEIGPFRIERELGRGGAETQLVRIAMSLCKRGWRVAILSLFPGSDFEEELFAVGIPHRYCESVRMPENRPLIPLRITLRLIRTLRVLRFLNRLSDLLFAAARSELARDGSAETYWNRNAAPPAR